MFSTKELKEFFPQTLNKSVYLDSAATALKYGPMLEKAYEFEKSSVANVHRGAHSLSIRATDLYEETRAKVAEYLNVSHEEIIFTTGTTDAINLLAMQFEDLLSEGDVVVLSEMEHHANLLPWQRLSKEKGIDLKFISVDDTGELNLEDLDRFISEGSVKLVSLCQVSNTLGTINDVEAIAKKCRKHEIYFGLDAAQAVTFMKPDLSKLGVDFYCFSAHKIFGPFGLGVLFLSKNLVTKFSPKKLGGGIITEVTYKDHGLLDGPIKFEPGTPNITAVISFSYIIDFLEKLDFDKVLEHDQGLLKMAKERLLALEGFLEVGTTSNKSNILSFNFENVHSNDLCELLDQQSVALRSGHHCTQPLFKKLKLLGSARASFSIYNSDEDVEKFVDATKKSLEMLR